MTHKNQKGFSHLLIVLVIVVLAVVGLAAYLVVKSNNSNGQSPVSTKPTQEETTETDIVLKNIGLESLDSVVVDNSVLGEFDSKGLKGFYFFGDTLEGGRINPNFEFSSLKEGTKVIASIDGIVAFIQEQTDSSDFEVFIQPKDGSMWTVGYDHLVNLTVSKGDVVKAGDLLGEPAVQNNGQLRFEIQINKDESGETTHYCPTVLLDDSVKATIESQLLEMQKSWESVANKELYDTDSQDPIGCLKPTLTVAEAEGR